MFLSERVSALSDLDSPLESRLSTGNIARLLIMSGYLPATRIAPMFVQRACSLVCTIRIPYAVAPAGAPSIAINFTMAALLLYYAAHEGKGRVKLVGPEFDRAQVAIAMQLDSPLRKKINRALVALRENGTYQQIYDKWFGGP